jgi:glutamate synthase (NADPH/NADH) small chain
VHQFELLPRPPSRGCPDNPWPQWPRIFRSSAAHDEGGERLFSISTERFLATTRAASRAGGPSTSKSRARHHRLPGPSRRSRRTWCCWRWVSSVPERGGLLSRARRALTDRGNVWRDERWMTSEEGVFTAGTCSAASR